MFVFIYMECMNIIYNICICNCVCMGSCIREIVGVICKGFHRLLLVHETTVGGHLHTPRIFNIFRRRRRMKRSRKRRRDIERRQERQRGREAERNKENRYKGNWRSSREEKNEALL